MMHDFARFMADVFPSIEPAKAREYLNALWRAEPVWSDLYAKDLPHQISQGDVVDPITFIVQDDSGEFGELLAPGMVLSHSCDLDNDEEIVFAACRPFAPYRKHKSAGDIKNNTFFALFYLAEVPRLGEIVVDFATLQSIRRKVLERHLTDGKASRVVSLTLLGYYFLIAKLTVRFLRPPPPDEARGFSRPTFRQRIRDVAQGMRSLSRYLLHGRS